MNEDVERIARLMMKAEHGDNASDKILVLYLRYARLAYDAMKAIEKERAEAAG